MIHVALDTSIYRADVARTKQAFRALERLAAVGFLQVHLPYVVQKEFTTHRQAEFRKHSTTILSEIRSLERLGLDDSLGEKVRQLRVAVEELQPQLARHAEREFQDWAWQIRAVRQPVEPLHGISVLESYFDGQAPFRAPRSREDIPDAFIYQVLLALKAKHGEVHFIVADNRLRTICQGKGFHVYASLDEFISSELPQGALRKHENIKRLVTAVIEVLPSFAEGFAEGIASNIVDELAGKELHSGRLEDDNHEGRIVMVGSPEEIVIEHREAEYYGEGLIMVPFSLKIDCLVEYAISKSVYYSLPDEKAASISVTDLNDYYYDAEEHFILKVVGQLAISLGTDENATDFGSSTIEHLLENADARIDSIVEMEILDNA